jgi:cardiolipin synthase
MAEAWFILNHEAGFWLALVWFAYLAGLAGWIALQKREPVATLSWILSLALLPVVGLLVYHLLGPQRIKRHRLKRLRARARIEEVKFGPRDDAGTSALMRLAQGSSGYLPSTAHDVRLLVDGTATFDALVEAIGQAERHVHLEYYIFDPDRTGTRIRDALVERARAGVTVRLLLDALGSASVSRAFLAPLVAAGGQVAWFHRFRLRRLWRPRLNLRSHRKIAVIDGRVGFTGGINISDTEDPALRADAFHDLHLRIEGEAVRWLQLAFAEDWIYASGRAAQTDTPWAELARGPIRTQVLPAGPDSPWETIHRVLIAAIQSARQRVWLVTPYFVPGEAARMALTSAALRGLDVRLLVPEMSDSRLVSAAARSYYDELLAAGVHVHEFPRMLHAKALLVDADTCVMGSSNFDNRSFRLNFELCVLFEDAGVAGRLESVLVRDFERSRQVLPGRTTALRPRLAEALARLLSPLL